MDESRNPQTEQRPNLAGFNQTPTFVDPAVALELADRANKEKFLQSYAANDDIGLSCKRAGITRKQFKQWMALDVEFAEEVSDTHEASVDEIQGNLKSIALDSALSAGARVQASKILLEAERPEKFGKREGNGPQTKPVIQIFLSSNPDKKQLPPGDIVEGEVIDGKDRD